MLKAISLDAPFPHAIAAGVKPSETRDRPPAGDMCPAGVRPQPGRAIARGERIAIHSTASLRGFGRRGTHTLMGTWDIERDQAGLLARGPGLGAPWRLALGVFVATAVVVDAVQVLAERGARHPDDLYPPKPGLGRSAIYDLPHEGDLPHQQGGLWIIGPGPANGGTPTRIEDQRPWGGYAPGRWVWILADVHRLPAADQIACPGCIDPAADGRPRHMHQGVWAVPDSITSRLVPC